MPHAHGSAAAANRRRLVAVLGLSIVMLIVETVGAVASNSLALLADAGHMLTDVSGIGLALLAIWFAGRAPTTGRTFGYLRLEIFAAVANAVLLFGIAAFILFEAWRRLSAPPEVASGLMMAVALLGLAANAISLHLLRDAQRESLNVRGAYLEVMGDFAGSAAVVIAAVVIAATGWVQADALASVVIALLILPRTFRLLRDATDVLLEATPKGIAAPGPYRRPGPSSRRPRTHAALTMSGWARKMSRLRRSSGSSSVGLPGSAVVSDGSTAMRSASLPTASEPMTSPSPSARAPWSVPIRSQPEGSSTPRSSPASARRAICAYAPTRMTEKTEASGPPDTSVPSPTDRPPSSQRASGMTPAPMNRFEAGQWATREPVSTSRASSRSDRWIAWASTVRSPSAPARSYTST